MCPSVRRLALAAALVAALVNHSHGRPRPGAPALDREARTLPVVVLRNDQDTIRDVSLEEALAAPAEELAVASLATQSLLLTCPLATAGATIHSRIDGLPLTITAHNVATIERQLKERQTVYAKAIAKRGRARLAAGYTSNAAGGCLDWGVNEMPVLAEQGDIEAHLTQGDMRHRAIVVESSIAVLHDANSDVMITGRITDKGIVFTTPDRGGVTGMATRRCIWTLTPADVQGSDWAIAFLGRAFAHRAYGDHAAMLADLDRSLWLHPDADVTALKAFVLATCSDERLRDGTQAVEAAELARTLAKGEPNIGLRMALAVAHAEAGNFATAIEHQKKVIEMVAEEEKPQQRENLRLFEAGRPFHEPRPFASADPAEPAQRERK